MSDTDRYVKERNNPTLIHCGSLRLTFDKSNLKMVGGRKEYNYPAVSGKRDGGGVFNYSVADQKAINMGPIPEGNYWVNPSELWKNTWYKRASTEGWGNYRITIHPFVTTKTYGRGGFFIHGGTRTGSIGCIDLTSHMDKFAHDLIREAGTRECHVLLTVDYYEH